MPHFTRCSLSRPVDLFPTVCLYANRVIHATTPHCLGPHGSLNPVCCNGPTLGQQSLQIRIAGQCQQLRHQRRQHAKVLSSPLPVLPRRWRLNTDQAVQKLGITLVAGGDDNRDLPIRQNMSHRCDEIISFGGVHTAAKNTRVLKPMSDLVMSQSPLPGWWDDWLCRPDSVGGARSVQPSRTHTARVLEPVDRSVALSPPLHPVGTVRPICAARPRTRADQI